MLLLLACAGTDDTAGWDTTAPATDTTFEARDLGGAFDADALEAHVTYLASEELEGREAGSAGDLLAVTHIAEALADAGFEPVDGAWEHAFVDSEGTDSLNVLGVLWGADEDVGHEIVVVGAHHDHLGVDRGGTMYPGANDDASGVALVLGLADAFGSGDAPDRTLVLAAFGSEEVNMDGSAAFLDDPPEDLPVADVVHYVNLDMVGAYDVYEVLYALDAVAGTVARRVVDDAAEGSSLNVDRDEYGELADSVNFCAAGIPEVFFFTEDPQCYHEPCDTADRVDYDVMSEVGALVAGVVDRLTDASVELASQRAEGCPVR